MVAVPAVPGAFAARRSAENDGLTAGRAEDFEMGSGGVAVAGQEVEHGYAAGDSGGVGGIAAITECSEKFSVSFARAGIAIAIQKFGVGGKGRHAVGTGLGGTGERSARAHAIARGFHLLNRIEALGFNYRRRKRR